MMVIHNLYLVLAVANGARLVKVCVETGH